MKAVSETSAQKSAVAGRYPRPQRKIVDMTDGPVFTKILFFILPLIITNLLQVLYNTADIIVVSLSGEPDAVGAIGTTGAFVNLVVNVFIGFATGVNVTVARHLGAKQHDRASKATHTAVIMSLIFGVAGGILGVIISRPVLALMGTQGKLLDLATVYTQIYFIGLPFTSVTNYLIAIFRAKGDTRTPLYILSLSGVLNVLLNLFFVLVVGLSVEGVAIATMIATAVSALFLLIKLTKDDSPCRLSVKKLCMDPVAFKDILYIGLPAGIQGSLFAISNIVLQSSILQVNNAVCPPGSAFEPLVKGNAAAANLENFIYMAQNSVYQAAITFTSQNVGAGKYKRVYRIMGCCYLLGVAISTVVSLLLVVLHNPLFALYGVHLGAEGSLERIAYDTAMLRMYYVYFPYAIISLMEVGSGLVRGLGNAISSTVISLVGACLLRIVWVMTVFKAIPTLEMIYLCLPISWLATALVFFIFTLVVLHKRIKAQACRAAISTNA